MKLGYARFSTDDQHLNLQLDALRACGCDSIYSDHGVSGTRVDRPGLRDALSALAPGDQLVVWKLDRLGRSLGHLINVISELDSTGIRVIFLTEAIDTRSASGKFMFHLMGALAKFERALVSERTRAGPAAARERGQRAGRPRALDPAALMRARTLLKTEPEQVVAKTLNVSRVTLRRALAAGVDTKRTYAPTTHAVHQEHVGRELSGAREPRPACWVRPACIGCASKTGSGAGVAPGTTCRGCAMLRKLCKPRQTGKKTLPGTRRIGMRALDQCALCLAWQGVSLNAENAT